MRLDKASILRIAPMLVLATLGLGVSCLIACGHADESAGSSESKVVSKRAAGYGGYGYGYGDDPDSEPGYGGYGGWGSTSSGGYGGWGYDDPGYNGF